MPSAMGAQSDTLPARLFAHARRYGSRIAHYYPASGAWYPVGWTTMAGLVRDIASGLIGLGYQPGEPVAILSGTRREWLYCDLAALACGGISAGIHHALERDACQAIAAHCEPRVCFVEDEVQLAKLLPCLDSVPALKHIVVIDPPADLHDDRVMSLASLIQRGRRDPIDISRRVRDIRSLDAAVFVYATGARAPRAAMLTHGNIAAALRALEATGLTAEDIGLSYLPLAHSWQRVMDYYGLWVGMQGAYARGRDTLVADIQQVKPTVIATVPAVLEHIYAAMTADAPDQTPGEQLFARASALVKNVFERSQPPAGAGPRLQAQLDLIRRSLFNRPLARLGGRLRAILLTGGSVARDVTQLFDRAGIRIFEGWGMTETFAVGAMNRAGAHRAGSVGKPLPSVEFDVGDDDELLVRGPNVFSGYYKAEHDTMAAFNLRGFLRTGDIARVDDDGFYYVAGRRHDLIVTATGTSIAPQSIENILRIDPRISQVIVVGDARPYLTALVSVSETLRESFDEDTLTRMIEGIIATKNVDLKRSEQVRRFRLLPYDLSEASGELTPTLRVKRDVVTSRFRYLIDEMYE